MTREEFWEWMALCPANKSAPLEEPLVSIVHNGGTEVRVIFYLSCEKETDDD